MSVCAPPMSLDELARFALGLARSTRRPPRAPHGRGGARQYELVWSDERVNAWLIHWAGEVDDTGFHDHDRSAAGIVVLEGEVVEERLTLDGRALERRHTAGEYVELAASAIHRVRHGGGEPALTLHAYSPPLQAQGVYRVDDDGALEREVISHTQELRVAPSVRRTERAPTSGPVTNLDELRRRYATDAVEMSWRALSDAELRADLRLATRLADDGRSRGRASGAVIAGWIEQELVVRAARASILGRTPALRA